MWNWSTGKNGEENKTLGTERCENIIKLYINKITINILKTLREKLQLYVLSS